MRLDRVHLYWTLSKLLLFVLGRSSVQYGSTTPYVTYVIC